MSRPLVDQIAQAVLYEGYILYPYRPSVKTRQRWTFGGLYPRAFSEENQGSDPWSMQAQCLIRADADTRISVKVCFLHLVDRSIEQAGDFARVPSLQVGDRTYQPWQEAVERAVEVDDLRLTDPPRREHFVFPARRAVEPLNHDGVSVGRIVREQIQIEGAVEIAAERKAPGVYQLTVRVTNETEFDPRQAADRDAALMRSLVSTHIVLTSNPGGFVLLTDPPPELQSLAEACENVGCWPVLVGDRGSSDTLLVSPIILSDYPQIAPESPGDLYDGCEIDEILTLRIMTLTDEEKQQATATDPMAARMLARTESLAREQLMNLHGVLRPAGSEARHG
jgi:hypothetical protein